MINNEFFRKVEKTLEGTPKLLQVEKSAKVEKVGNKFTKPTEVRPGRGAALNVDHNNYISMKLSEINDLFSKTSLNSFKERNKEEFISFSSLQNKIGSSVPIILEEDFDSLEINNSHVLRLCDLYISGDLSAGELSYIVDALLLSEKVIVNNESLEILESMTDPSINGKFTAQEAQSVKDQIVK